MCLSSIKIKVQVFDVGLLLRIGRQIEVNLGEVEYDGEIEVCCEVIFLWLEEDSNIAFANNTGVTGLVDSHPDVGVVGFDDVLGVLEGVGPE